MELDQTLPKIDINHNNFPAKLWSLTNNPQNSSLFWSRNGDFLMVDRQSFEMDLLSPLKPFKSSNFSSFIRQLNLYGFRKVFHGPAKDRPRNLHLFHSPHFRQGRPELLVHLKRLTISNRAKIEAGGETSCPKPGRERQRAQKTGPAQGSHGSGSKSRQLQECEPSPIPGPSWILPGIPLSVLHPYPYGVPRRTQAGPAVFFSQDSRYIPHQMPYPAGFYSPVICPCCSAGFMDADRAGGDSTSLSYSNYTYYPQNYSVSPSIQSSSWSASGPCEAQRGDINLDRVFQMVEDLQGLPPVHIVRVGTPRKDVPQRSLSPPPSPRESDAHEEDSASSSQKASADPEVTEENLSV